MILNYLECVLSFEKESDQCAFGVCAQRRNTKNFSYKVGWKVFCVLF